MSCRPPITPVPGLIVPLIWSDSLVLSGFRSTRGNPVASQCTPGERPVNRPHRTAAVIGGSQSGSVISTNATSNAAGSALCR